MSGRLVGQHPAQVLADQQPGHRHVAAEEPVLDGDHPKVIAAQPGQQRGQHQAAQFPGEDGHWRIGVGTHRHRRTPIGARRPEAQRRRTLHGGEEPRGATPFPVGTLELPFEGPGHAHPVLAHLEPFVDLGGREASSSLQVVLVGGMYQPPADHPQEPLLPGLDTVEDRPRLGDGVGPHPRFAGVSAHPEGYDAHAGQVGVPVSHPGQGVLQPRSVVDLRAHHHLAVDDDPVVQQGP